MPNADHYAVVVGLNRYPTLSDPAEAPSDLKGPENDADAVADWLRSAQGGDLPPENVTVIKSPAPPLPGTSPTRDEIERTFVGFEDIARRNEARVSRQWVGRRLYVYMAGHGFSPRRNHGCLFAANATPRFGYHVYPSSWLEWFQDAAYFDELVLWMDCCMNRITTLPLAVPPAPPQNRSTPAGPSFIAFAAQRPLKAVERAFPEDGGRVHGVFTWTLLEGLQGAAANAYGMVTGRSLADWIRNAQKARMDKRDLADPDVADEPEVAKEDETLIFARGLSLKSYDVTLSFPPSATGRVARVWSGRPAQPETFTVDTAAKTLRLRPGLHLAEVADAGLRHGFEVAGPAQVTVADAGAPVADRPSDLFRLGVDARGSPTEIFIIDERFGLVDRSVERLDSRLPFGLYKVKTRLGRTIDEQIMLLDRDAPAMRPQAASVASPAPLPNTTLTHEYHVAAAHRALAEVHVTAGDGARLAVMTRAWSETGQTQSDLMPWSDVSLVDARGRVVADMSRDGERDSGGDPVSICSLAVAPGAYFLRHKLDNGTEVEQSIVVPERWFVHAYLLRLANPGGAGFKPTPQLSFIMHEVARGAVAFSDTILTTLETARIALADERRVLGKEIETLLLSKSDNPIAGIIGGHLLLVEHARDPSRDIRALDEVVTHLRGLVGEEHPDVEALSLRCPDPGLRRTRAIKTPPMFQRSWTLMLEASQHRSSLVPRSLWQRAHAHSALAPYLIWAVDEQSKRAASEALEEAMISLAVSATELALPTLTPIVGRASAGLARHVLTPHLKKLSKQFVSAAPSSAARLQIPPSALSAVTDGILKKLRG